MTTDFVGDAIGPRDIERHVEDHLRRWLPTYLAHTAQRRGIDYDKLPKVREWSRRTRYTNILGNDLPIVVIQCPGLRDKPEKHGNGRIDAWWVVGVGAILPGNSEDSAKEIAELFGIAIRKIMLQKPDLEGFSDRCAWEDERYDDLSHPGQEEYQASVRSVFSLLVAGADDWTLGPAAPNPDDDPGAPFPDSPLARSIMVDVAQGG